MNRRIWPNQVMNVMKLRHRLSLFSIGQLVVFGAVFALALWSFERVVLPSFEDLLRGKSERITRLLGADMDVGLAAEDPGMIRDELVIIERDPDVTDVVVRDPHGTVVSEIGASSRDDLFSGPANVARMGPHGISTWTAVTLEGVALGSVAVVVSTERFDSLARWARWVAAVVTLLWLVAFGYSIAFADGFVRPIGAMMDFSRRVAGGELADRLSIEAPGELGDLRDYLNEMTSDLERRELARKMAITEVEQMQREAMEQRQRMELELRLAQKLEAVGQLAAGVAHEINTPIQYVGDNLSFLRESVVDVLRTVTDMLSAAQRGRTESTAALVDELAAIAVATDFPYLASAMPDALESITGGVARVAKIVRAMKELAHPGPREATAVDISRALANALEITASAYRMTADVETDFAPTPPVVCFGSEVNQVFLNLIVNAAQAMENSPGVRGMLTIATRVDGPDVVVSISDTGGGIEDSVRERVFDAFFTTKEVGRGTGQGLAISRAIVVDRHGGSLTFESTVGVGTTFSVRLPISGPTPAISAAS